MNTTSMGSQWFEAKSVPLSNQSRGRADGPLVAGVVLPSVLPSVFPSTKVVELSGAQIEQIREIECFPQFAHRHEDPEPGAAVASTPGIRRILVVVEQGFEQGSAGGVGVDRDSSDKANVVRKVPVVPASTLARAVAVAIQALAQQAQVEQGGDTTPTTFA